MGRSTSTTAPTISGSNASGDDLYFRAYEFLNANTSTVVSEVIENAAIDYAIGGAGAITDDKGTDATILDNAALNFVGINDDNTITAFTGETGGDWALAVAGYIESGGTDAAIYLMSAAMASAGTIDGGSTTNPDAADSWGTFGFAIIGTTVVDTRVPYKPSVPQLLPQ